MNAERYTHRLTGCTPVPLAHYLKALGVLRLVSEQVDRSAQGWWSGDIFHLRTTLGRDQLCAFLADDYRPTPVIAPWNGGSGFYPKDNQRAITAIGEGVAERTTIYRQTISACRQALSALNLKEKPSADNKERLLVACRSRLPDEAVTWLDAAFVLTADGPKYPPLLGTGGNDGRLEFTNNFMQRLLDLFDPKTGSPLPSALSWWDQALFSQVKNDLQKNAILGQFDPGALERPVNPCDYVLMIEGSLAFATAAVKRHEAAASGVLSYPFSVRSAGIGYGSAASADEASSRAELWLPLWSQPSSAVELETLFSEGRAQLHRRVPKNGVDFARAVSTLGIDRGIDEFARYGFHVRNGLAFFAVPLGRFKVQPQPQVNLLAEIDHWLDNFRRTASSDHAPSRAQRALRRLETAILDLCQQRSNRRLQAVLIALGEIEAVLATSAKWRADKPLRPVPLLSRQWLSGCDDATPEFRLAASLAGVRSPAVGDFRQHLEPVAIKGRRGEDQRRWAEWDDTSSALCKIVWSEGSLEDNLLAVLERRNVEAIRAGERAKDGTTLAFPGQSCRSAPLEDIAAFLRRETDDARIAALTRGLTLLDWETIRRDKSPQESQHHPHEQHFPDAIYALLKLCHTAHEVRGCSVRLEPAIVRLTRAGRLDDATKLTARRLRASSLPPAIRVAWRDGSSARRIAAALLFPVGWSDVQQLANIVLKPQLDAYSV